MKINIINEKVITAKLMDCRILIILFTIIITFLVGCSSNNEFPFPTNPVEIYSPPKSALVLDVSPNPTNSGPVMQTWTIKEVNSVGMRIDSIRMNTIAYSGELLSSYKFTEDDINQLWESTYIPKEYIGVGTIEIEIIGEHGDNIYIQLFGHDDHLYPIFASDTLNFLP